ncbi:MAG: cytochrome C [Ottowia sp.]|nr:MAG: cytochrome C [Ottowia sp.]
MKAVLSLLTLLLALPAQADRLPLPADTPPAYRAECGSCHLAYPPALLGANDWQQLMGKLDSHFGSDAAVNPEIGQKLTAFLVANASGSNRVEGAGNPPRISQTTHFVKEHRKIPARYWTDTRVRSAANCEACHTNAANGRFSEHDIAIAELRR